MDKRLYILSSLTILQKWIALATTAWKMSLIELLERTESLNKKLKIAKVKKTITQAPNISEEIIYLSFY